MFFFTIFPAFICLFFSYVGQFFIVYLNNVFVQFTTDLGFIIDVIKPQSMYSKLLAWDIVVVIALFAM